MEAKMIVVLAVLEAQAGKEKEFEDALRAMIPQVQNEDGTLTYILHRAKDNPAKFMFYEKYKDDEAFAYHGSTPYIAELFGKIGPLFAAEPSIVTYEILAAIDK